MNHDVARGPPWWPTIVGANTSKRPVSASWSATVRQTFCEQRKGCSMRIGSPDPTWMGARSAMPPTLR